MLFAVGLLASGLASSSVGAYAGAMIMQGLLHRSIPMMLRRLITLCPAVAILAHRLRPDPHAGAFAGRAVVRHAVRGAAAGRLTSNRKLMGSDTNHPVTTVIGWAVAVLVSLLNVLLIYLTVKG